MVKNLIKSESTSYSQFLKHKPLVEDAIDINFFKRSVSLHYQHHYAAKKRHNSLYRFVFFGFSLMFCVFGVLIFFKTINPACSIYLGNCSLIKNSVNALCMLLSIGSFFIGYKIHPEKEAIKHLVKKIENELYSPAKHLQIEFNAIIGNLSQMV